MRLLGSHVETIYESEISAYADRYCVDFDELADAICDAKVTVEWPPDAALIQSFMSPQLADELAERLAFIFPGDIFEVALTPSGLPSYQVWKVND